MNKKIVYEVPFTVSVNYNVYSFDNLVGGCRSGVDFNLNFNFQPTRILV